MSSAPTLTPHPYTPFAAIVEEATQVTQRERYYRIRLPQPLRHQPGQFMMVGVLGVGEAPISISNGPTDEAILEMVIRKAGRLTTVLHALSAGDSILLRGPYGSGFSLDALYGHDILFIAGGLGLVPLRSLIQPVIEHRDRFGQITVISGARNPAEELWRNDLASWAATDGVTVYRTVDNTESMPWKGHVGLVTEVIPKLDIDPERVRAVLCGPPVMYKFVAMSLAQRRVSAEKIYVDLERRMKCGVGKCGHCQIDSVYCCQEGPVFLLSELARLAEALQ